MIKTMSNKKFYIKPLGVLLVALIMLFVSACDDGKTESLPVQKTFSVTVTDASGEKKDYTFTTQKETVGEALQSEGFISGEEGQYGLYVKTVAGITADYDRDKMYWSFYVDGQYSSKGADKVKIKDGETYEFKILKS